MENLTNLSNVVNSAYKSAISEVNKLGENIKIQAKDLVQDTIDKILQEIDGFISTLGEIKVQAQAAGVDISECTRENEAELGRLRESVIVDLNICIKEKVCEVDTLIQNTVSSVKSICNEVNQLALQLIKQESCSDGMLAKISVKVDQLPLQISNDVFDGINLILKVEKDLRACALSKVASVNFKGVLILEEIRECVTKKMKGTSDVI